GFGTTGFSPGDVLTVAQQVASAVTSTGRYSWSLQVTMNYGTPIVRTVSGVAYVVTQDASPFGAACTFSLTDTLLAIAADANGPAGKLRAYGTGGWRFYQGTTGTFTSPAGDPGTFVKNADNSYTYTLPDGRKWQWDSGGKQTALQSADGQELISFQYDSNNALATMTAIDGGVTTFAYDQTSGLLSTIKTVNNRTTTPTYSATDLTGTTSPDGGLHTLTYDGSHRLTSEALGGVQDQWAYAASGTLGTFTWGSSTSPSTTVVKPAVTQGLSALVAGSVQA